MVGPAAKKAAVAYFEGEHKFSERRACRLLRLHRGTKRYRRQKVDDPTLIDWRRVTGHHQVTDLYLLALAVKHDAALASFDQRITWAAVRGAKARHLVLL